MFKHEKYCAALFSGRPSYCFHKKHEKILVATIFLAIYDRAAVINMGYT
jgi:hypothetical protein